MFKNSLSLLLLSSCSILANTLIYSEDFSQFTPKPTKGISEVVEIQNHPEVHKALLLKTTEGGNKATPSWTSPNFGAKIIDANPETVVVDYWLNPVTPSARYMLFVRDTRGTQMACSLFTAGNIMPIDNGTWLSHSPLEAGQWHHVRYVLRSIERTYDIYIDDMATPRVQNWRFRYPNTTTPASLWIEGSETEPSETLLANVQVSVPQNDAFSAEQWEIALRKEANSLHANIMKQLAPLKGDLDNALAARRNTIQTNSRQAMEKITAATNSDETLIALHHLQQIQEEAASLAEDARKYLAAFGKGTEGAKRGLLFFPEDSTVKAMPGLYFGNDKKQAELLLAQGETGGIQAIAIAMPKRAIHKAQLSVRPKDDLAQSLKTNIFFEDDVATCFAGKPSESYPDVLRPSDGTETFQKPQTLVRFWIDVHAPHAQSGKAEFNIVLKADDTELSFPLSVTVYPFALPKEFTLSTAFCFTPSWAKAFYGKEMPTEKRRAYLDFILDHRLDPMNLWNGAAPFLSEEETRYCLERGMKNIYLPIIAADKNQANMQKNLEFIDRNGWRKRVVAFGFDEVLFNVHQLKAMQAAFENTKQHFPDIPRLNTARIDERLYGYVDIWCPLFQHFDEKMAAERRKLGEQIWWYPTDYPLKPCVNFNLDSPGIAPRVIPWLTKRLNITGLLYWGLNREWLTNAYEHERLTEQERISMNMEWMTDDVRQKMKDGLRWPAVPWVPYFRSVMFQTAKPSPTNGGGNLMYPGPDWTPWPSVRLKNLRDGLQDTEYFQILATRLEAYEKRPDADQKLVKRAKAALQVPDSVVTRLDHFDHSSASIIAHKRLLAELIIALQ